MTYTNLPPSLLAQNLIEKRVTPPVPDKLPRWYKPNEHCAFHSYAPGNDTENCFVFKGKVKGLVRSGIIKFGDMPNMETNPFPEHRAVNMITEDENLIMDVLKVKTSLVHVHLKLFKAGIIKKNHEKCSVCLRYSKGCFDMHKDIQMLISNGVLQVSGKKKNDEVSVIVPVFNKPNSFEIFCPPRESTHPVDSAKHLDIKIPYHFPYKSDKVIPWGYEPTMIMNGVEKPLVNNKVVTNIADASGLTRSGRVFTSANLRGGKLVVEKPDNGKALLVIPESKPIHDVEAEELLRLIRKSDYKFQGLEIANAVRIEDVDEEDKVGTYMASLKDMHQVVASGQASRWGKIVQLSDNKYRSELGFNPYEQSAKAPRTIQEVKLIPETFRSGEFMDQSCDILQDDADEGPSFVTRRGSSQRTPNWTSVDIPKIMHVSE
ncbi:hypothetical protein KIW84_043832 [Lathyrus oleraceus]|uniref:Uncharacterized protein n=1 Tax=Pisum sativum TaxID=3888 RepID=A0A9D4XGC3_PEA|nr:hypothetical protein KIW84_043832 [Pisum sativum]